MPQDANLEEELAFYERSKAQLLEQHEGFFVLIRRSELAGVYPTAEAAYKDGLEQFGIEPFLVKQVLEIEPSGFIPAFTSISSAHL